MGELLVLFELLLQLWHSLRIFFPLLRFLVECFLFQSQGLVFENELIHTLGRFLQLAFNLKIQLGVAGSKVCDFFLLHLLVLFLRLILHFFSLKFLLKF